jgi:hypothetical protein
MCMNMYVLAVVETLPVPLAEAHGIVDNRRIPVMF